MDFIDTTHFGRDTLGVLRYKPLKREGSIMLIKRVV